MDSNELELPPLPRFQLKQVFEVRSRLIGEAALPHYTDRLTGDAYDAFVADVQRVMPSAIQYETLHTSCRTVLDRSLTVEAMRELAWRLAGNIPQLVAGQPALPWTTQYECEWAPAQVVRVWPHRNHRGELGNLCALKVLSGSVCPMVLQKFWSKKACSYMARKLGFSRSYGVRPYQSAALLVGLRMCLLFEPELCRETPAFRHVVVPSFCITHNTTLLKARIQRKPPCPQGYTHQCFRCVVGYDQCPCGTHRDTFFSGQCPNCNQAEALFDPEMSNNICRKCFITNRLREE